MKTPLNIGLLFLSIGISSAQSYQASVASQDRGWVTSNSFANVGNTNFLAGNYNSIEYRNFFVFDLADVEEEIISASLSLFAPPTVTYSSANAVEIFSLNHITTSVPADRSFAQAGNVFSAIGNGTLLSYASINSSTSTLTFDLNSSAALAALNSGALLTIGGQVLSLDNNPNTVEYIFGNSQVAAGGTNPMLLNLTVLPNGGAVPEVSTSMLALLAGFGLLRRKR
jgi:hypothetical protein